MAQPQRKSSELLEQINRLTPQDFSDQLKLQRLFKEAEQLASLPSATAEDKIVLAVTYGLKFDLTNAYAIFDALLETHAAPEIYRNYAVVANRANDLEKAITVIQHSLSKYPKNHLLLESLCSIALLAGHLTLARKSDELFTQIVKRSNSDNPLINIHINSAISFLQSKKISEESLIAVVHQLNQVLYEEKVISPKDLNLFIQEDEEDEWLVYEVVLPITPERSVELDGLLADKLIEENLLSAEFEHFIVTTGCMESEPSHAS